MGAITLCMKNEKEKSLLFPDENKQKKIIIISKNELREWESSGGGEGVQILNEQILKISLWLPTDHRFCVNWGCFACNVKFMDP